jgi:Nif-specific regulatory protein
MLIGQNTMPGGDALAYSRFVESQLETLFHVSKVLSCALDPHRTVESVLRVLHERGGMRRGLVTLPGPCDDGVMVAVVHGAIEPRHTPVLYRPGEGIIGAIVEKGEAVIVHRIADEPRFLDRLRLYDPELPFIGVPVDMGDGTAPGVLAAQPEGSEPQRLDARAHFLMMVANLIAQSVRRCREVEAQRRDLTDERDELRRAVRGNYGFDNIVGHAASMRRLFEQVRQVAKWSTTVLIRGESGTGKELVANAIHYNSPRANGPLIKLNCAALPDNLLESELFGHEKGAFTGASNQRKGRFEQADGGTLFLDEVGEISPTFQAKLLRVLQEGEFERVGGTRTIKVDVRIIAATNCDLEESVGEGSFREDLYYRLNVMPLHLPALRERIEDIPDIACFLVEKLARMQQRQLALTDSALRLLTRHLWPGNVRELENCLERAAIMSESGVIDRDAIALTGIEERMVPIGVPASPTVPDLNDPQIDERERIIAALEQAGWVQAKAARLLGMTPRQVAYRIQMLAIRVRKI